MDVEFDSFDDDSSIATLRIKASSQYCRNDEVFLESLMTAVKIEMGLPPAADVHLHVEDKKVHATLNKRNSSRKEEVPNVDLVDVYTQKVIPLQGALLNKPFAILGTLSPLHICAMMMIVMTIQRSGLHLPKSSLDTTHVLALHVGATSAEALDVIDQQKLYFPQQTLHHYHVPTTSLALLQQSLSINDEPTRNYVLIDKKLQVLAASNDLSNLDGGLQATLSSPLSLPPPLLQEVHTTHDDCHLKQYPNVEVVHMPTQRTMHLFDFLTAGTLTVIDTTMYGADFWSTTCVRCPAAIAKLLTHYKKTQSSISATTIQYVLINTDNAVMGWDLVQDHEWVPFGSIVHLHVTVAVKESLKAFMAMKQMPHHVLLDVNHRVLQNGKFFSYDHVDAALVAARPSKVEHAPLSFTLDDDDGDELVAPPAAPQEHAFVLDDDF
ncbi:hypothetical protein AaE_014143 [Aphanomyces astaci]|uniref:Thioredoxin domain-containing protein n=1 Tax=Aphanomyces astaci TaxID=112090 RepID=A0A6A4Z7S9_APHAT|nr:hypothetical protein AaE_014143 [Aphanomyces astaci]